MKTRGMSVTCILCPLGCTVIIKKTDDGEQVTGNRCDRGKIYAIKEITNPTRTLTTTVKTCFKDYPRIPVKTDREVPLGDLFLFMDVINTIMVTKRLKPGDVIMKALLNTPVNLVATGDMTQI